MWALLKKRKKEKKNEVIRINNKKAMNVSMKEKKSKEGKE